MVLVTASAAAAALQPIRLPHRGETTVARVRHGVLHIPRGQARGRVTVLVGLRLPPLAQRYGPGLFAFGPRKKLDVASSSSQAYLARLASAQAVAAARDPPRCAERADLVPLPDDPRRDGGQPALRRPAAADAGRRGAQGLPERPLPPRHEPEPLGDPGRHVLGDDRRTRPGNQDRRGRRRRRRDEPVLQPGRLLVPGRLPEGRQEVDDAEGDRRARLPRPRLRAAGPPCPEPAGLVPRHARRRDRRGRGRHRRLARPGPPAPSAASPGSRRGRGSATTASSTCRCRPAASTPSRPRSCSPSRRP